MQRGFRIFHHPMQEIFLVSDFADRCVSAFMFLYGFMFTVSGLKPQNQNYTHQGIRNPNPLYISLGPYPVYYSGLAGSSLFFRGIKLPVSCYRFRVLFTFLEVSSQIMLFHVSGLCTLCFECFRFLVFLRSLGHYLLSYFMFHVSCFSLHYTGRN